MWHSIRVKFKGKQHSDEDVVSFVHTCVFCFLSRTETLLCGFSLLFLRKTGSEAGGGRNTQEVKWGLPQLGLVHQQHTEPVAYIPASAEATTLTFNLVFNQCSNNQCSRLFSHFSNNIAVFQFYVFTLVSFFCWWVGWFVSRIEKEKKG